jgi:hypothetical protein
MSGGRNYTEPSKSVRESEDVFKSSVDEVGEFEERERIRNVFISFHIEDESQVNLLRSQAKSENFDIEFRDYSVKEPFDEKWKTQCRERIAQTSATICMIGPDTANRPAVQWELEESYKQGKKVIGVRISRDRNDPVPQALIDHGSPVVNWDLKEIQRLLG